jgi:hypothetical protein
MSQLFKSIFCYTSCVVSEEITQHYKKYTQDYQIYENNDYIITASLDVDVLRYIPLLYYYFVNVKNICRLNYTSHVKSEALFKRKGYKMICLSQPNVLSRVGIPAFIESVYGSSTSIIGQNYHVLSYIDLKKGETPTNRQLYIAIETNANDFPYFYIAMTQHDLFEMLKRRYLYETLDIKNELFVYDEIISSTKSVEDIYIENKQKKE